MVRLLRIFLICNVLLFAAGSAGFAQIVVKGRLRDQQQKAVANAVVSIVKRDSITVLGYILTDEKGVFALSSPTGKESSLLKLNAYGFKTQYYTLKAGTQYLEIILEEKTTPLKEVNIHRERPLSKKGDTLDYDVRFFTKGQDRVIGDVIRNLPGIQMSADGQISYNGRAINKFYIDGDDLLGNKYNLANNAIPYDAVEKVQILEQHQPVNALRDKVKSEEAALNLKLKNTAKVRLFGTGEVGLGIPDAYNVNADVMLFKDQLKMLNKLSYNSTGLDLNYNLKTHSLQELFDTFDLPVKGQLTSVKTITDANLPQNRWLLNRTGLLTANTLIKLRKDESLRLNAYYLPYQTTQSYSAESKYNLPDTTYRQYEQQRIRATGKEIFTSLDYVANKKEVYIENKLETEFKDEEIRAALDNEKAAAVQRLSNDRHRLENNFRLVKTFGDRYIFEGFSKVGYISTPEYLYISPGVYELTLNNGIPYEGAGQEIRKSAFYTKNKFSLRLGSGKLKQTYELAYHIDIADLKSNSSLRQLNSIEQDLGNGYRNHLSWQQEQLKFGAGYSYTYKSIVLNTTLPLNLRSIKIEDMPNRLDTLVKAVNFEPSVNVQLNLSQKHSLQLRMARSLNYGNPEEMLSGNIIRNYRTIGSNSFILNKAENYNSSLIYAFRNPIQILFTTLSLNYTHGSNNTITKSLLQSDGLIKTDRVLFDNSYERWMLMGNISKYLFDLKSTLRLGASLSQMRQQQIQNNYLIPIKNQGLNIDLELDTKVSDKFNFNLKGLYNISRALGVGSSGLEQGLGEDELLRREDERFDQNTIVRSGIQKLTVTYFLKPELYLQVDNEYRLLKAEQTKGNVFFNDLKLQYTLPKSKTDIGLSLTNTLNKKSFLYEALDFNNSVTQIYTLRPRTLLLNVRFVL